MSGGETCWPQQTLRRLADIGEIHIAPYRPGGTALRATQVIWSVVVDGRLYIRSWKGTGSHWYRSAIASRSGRITAAGEVYEVLFDEVDALLNDRIDQAYATKYAGSAFMAPMVAQGPRQSTLEVLPASID